ncbi:MAG: response regulator [Calditrichaceae bacterium]
MIKRILVVDDEPQVREVLADFLTFKGYEVILAPDGKSGYACFLETMPDAAVVDVEMPVMNGLQFSRSVLKENIKFPIIIITAFLEKYSKADIINLGVKEVLQKPLNLNDLFNRLQRVLSPLACFLMSFYTCL